MQKLKSLAKEVRKKLKSGKKIIFENKKIIIDPVCNKEKILIHKNFNKNMI